MHSVVFSVVLCCFGYSDSTALDPIEFVDQYKKVLDKNVVFYNRLHTVSRLESHSLHPVTGKPFDTQGDFEFSNMGEYQRLHFWPRGKSPANGRYLERVIVYNIKHEYGLRKNSVKSPYFVELIDDVPFTFHHDFYGIKLNTNYASFGIAETDMHRLMNEAWFKPVKAERSDENGLIRLEFEYTPPENESRRIFNMNKKNPVSILWGGARESDGYKGWIEIDPNNQYVITSFDVTVVPMNSKVIIPPSKVYLLRKAARIEYFSDPTPVPIPKVYRSNYTDRELTVTTVRYSFDPKPASYFSLDDFGLGDAAATPRKPKTAMYYGYLVIMMGTAILILYLIFTKRRSKPESKTFDPPP